MKLIFLIFTAIFGSSISSEILCIYPLPLHSHTTVYNSVTMELLKRGHKITLVTAYPRDNERNHVNVTLIDLSFAKSTYKKSVEDFLTNKSDGKELTNKFINLVREEFTSNELRNLIKSDKKFDLLLIENVGFSPFHAFAEHFNVPVVGINSADLSSAGHEIMGNVAHPVSHPDRVLAFPIAKTFLERLQSTMYCIAFNYLIIPMIAKDFDAITEEHFPHLKVKTFYELLSNIDIALINVHPAMGYMRPILPNTIPLGFLHIQKPTPLPDILQELLDKNENGVIYVSFGTIFKAHYFGNKIKNLLEAFEDLPYLFLWKFDGELETSPKNVILQNWFPQSDLLAHPNVKVFITQGGQQSVEEAVIRKVPILIMPIASDQRSNAIRMEERKVAKILNIHQDEHISSNDIKNAILELINDESYKTNIEDLARLVEDVPMTSRDKAVWWIEYVIRNGGAKHIHYEQKNIPFYQYHYYDVIAFVVAVITLIIVTIALMLRCIAKYFKLLMSFKSKRD